MLIYIFYLIITMECIAYCNTENNNNVGTVLFSTTDMDKTRWNTDEIALLKARRYFQNLLPPPLFVSTLNENYVDLLFNYFKEAYTAIKRETDDPNMDRTMTTALSDSIGGYLKAWVLPVTKFAFYGGMISEQNVTTLFEFYDEIKRYLHTDGDGWHKPKTNLFDVSIRSADRKLPIITEGENVNPCEHFVFFEKTPEGFNVPIPRVSWDGDASKLFLPLKNHTIYAMNSTNSSLALLKYYETAKYCIQRRYPSMLNNFEGRFQSWLATEVLPHLGDDNVYLALGSVLTVMNKTQELYNNVLYMYSKKPKLCKKVHAFAFSKKFLIVTLLIFIEVVWCCVALFYACYSKRRKNKVSQDFVSVEQRPLDPDESFNTPDAHECKPFVEPVRDSDATSKGGEAVQTDVDTLFVRGKCCNPKCICHPDASTVTQSIGIAIGSSDPSHPKVHKKKALKANSSQSVTFSALCLSNSNTAVPISSSQTIINTVSTTSDCRLKNKTDLTSKRGKRLKSTSGNKIETSHAVAEIRKSNNDVTCYKRELKTTESRHSSRNKVTEVIKSTMLPDITKIVASNTKSREQSIDTTDFLKSKHASQTKGTQNMPMPINSSKKLNTDLSINNHMRNEGSQCIGTVKTAINPTNTEKTVQSVSFIKKENKDRTLSGSYAGFIAYTPAANLELVKKETLIIEKPMSIKEKQSVNLTYTSASKKRSLHTLGPQSIVELSRNGNSRNQKFATYPSQQKFDKSRKDSKSKSSVKIEPKVSTPKRSKKLEPFIEEITRPSTSIAKKKKPSRTETETNSTRIQKEFKDAKYVKEPYWEITIDEPQKDVYVGIKGTIKIDSRNVKKSRIPKLSVRTVEPRSTSNSPRAHRAGSLIPQLRKKALDDLVLKTSTERNKMNTTI